VKTVPNVSIVQKFKSGKPVFYTYRMQVSERK
jgi:hypothetical protein